MSVSLFPSGGENFVVPVEMTCTECGGQYVSYRPDDDGRCPLLKCNPPMPSGCFDPRCADVGVWEVSWHHKRQGHRRVTPCGRHFGDAMQYAADTCDHDTRPRAVRLPAAYPDEIGWAA